MGLLNKDIFESVEPALEFTDAILRVRRNEMSIQELYQYCTEHFLRYHTRMSWQYGKAYIQIQKDCKKFWIGGYENKIWPDYIFKVYVGHSGRMIIRNFPDDTISSVRQDCIRWVVPADSFIYLCQVINTIPEITTI